jgi:hypothetical protein
MENYTYDNFIIFVSIIAVIYILLKLGVWIENGFTSDESKLKKTLNDIEENNIKLAEVQKEIAENNAQLKQLYKEKEENDALNLERVANLLNETDEYLLNDIKEFIKTSNESFDITHDKLIQDENLKVLLESINELELQVQGSINSNGHLYITNLKEK